MTSSAAGVVALKTQLEDQVEKCPGQKIVLLGYSQGAQVVGDVLSGGGGGDLGNETRPESFEVGKHGMFFFFFFFFLFLSVSVYLKYLLFLYFCSFFLYSSSRACFYISYKKGEVEGEKERRGSLCV